VSICQRSRFALAFARLNSDLASASYGSPGELLLLRVPATPAVPSLALPYGGNLLANWKLGFRPGLLMYPIKLSHSNQF